MFKSPEIFPNSTKLVMIFMSTLYICINFPLLFIYLFIVFVVLGLIELKVSRLLGKCSTTRVTPSLLNLA
jgi:hypothetical protein